jgi:hypothetical protein
MGTQYNILDERYQTELDIGTFNIGLKGSEFIIMSDTGLNFLMISNLWNLTGAPEQDSMAVHQGQGSKTGQSVQIDLNRIPYKWYIGWSDIGSVCQKQNQISISGLIWYPNKRHFVRQSISDIVLKCPSEVGYHQQTFWYWCPPLLLGPPVT